MVNEKKTIHRIAWVRDSERNTKIYRILHICYLAFNVKLEFLQDKMTHIPPVVPPRFAVELLPGVVTVKERKILSTECKNRDDDVRDGA